MVWAALEAGLSGAGSDRTMREAYARFEGIEPGMSEHQVREELGEPYREYSSEDGLESYWQPGHAHPEPKDFHRVLVYRSIEPVLYVFLDRDGRVERTFVGGS